MSWTKEKHTRRPHEWKIPREHADEHAAETSAVEDLAMLPQDITLLPQDIQTGFEKWDRQQINLSSEWEEDPFYPRAFRWGSSFYPVLGGWLDGFYAITGGWSGMAFYPQNHLNVWQPRSDGPKIESDFYPQNFKWIAAFYMIQDEWTKQAFYPANIHGVWNASFYAVQGGWYLTSDYLEAVITEFSPLGL